VNGPENPTGTPRSGFEQDLRNAAARAEEELQRLIRYLNDEVVPDVRKHSSVALRSASDGLRSLAEKMEQGNRR
jgi:bisphosphoglycerate-dependent phosphoglycerate mutase